MKVKQETDLVRVKDISVSNIEIVIDDDSPNKVELYMLDPEGERLEGGTFDRQAFMDHILKFYNDNY